MTEAVFILLAGIFTAICYIKYLWKRDRKKELLSTLVILAAGTYMFAGSCLHWSLPNPIAGIELVITPLVRAFSHWFGIGGTAA